VGCATALALSRRPGVRITLLEALKSEGFGVLTEIDVKATLAEEVDGRLRRAFGRVA
jgi:2-polyprenyl-6-methoxyphenol hydroxylase-like FAD-dependent oxidoreductase